MPAATLLIEIAKDATKEKTYAAVARRINVTPQTLQQWKDGSIPLTDDRISQLAQVAKMPVEFWLPKIYAEQAKSVGAKRNWERIAEIVRLTVQSAAVLAVIVITHRLSGQDGALSALMLPAVIDPVCIMRSSLFYWPAARWHCECMPEGSPNGMEPAHDRSRYLVATHRTNRPMGRFRFSGWALVDAGKLRAASAGHEGRQGFMQKTAVRRLTF